MKYLAILLIIVLAACGSATEQGAQSNTTTLSSNLRVNQLGYYPNQKKVFAVVDFDAQEFAVVNESGETVFTGSLSESQAWDQSGEQVQKGDFSDFQNPGTYQIQVGEMISYPFEITDGLYEDALKASIKSYYYQRASMEIAKEFGGEYARAAGHPDDNCLYHVSSGESGTMSSPGGWYDAGDYGKYIVNAALSVGQMLNYLEMQPSAVGETLNIPESGNGIEDLADELKYELDWMKTMQRTDGAVHHKLTALTFSGFIMPEDYDLDRYVIGVGTAPSLSYAAVMAQASRVFSDIDADWSADALASAQKAYEWAQKNPDIAFTNPEDVVTGQYDDNRFKDDFYWATVELRLATNDDKYDPSVYAQPVWHEITNSWRHFVRNVAFHSALINDANNPLRDPVIRLSDSIVNVVENHPYAIGLNHFEWGSNSDILNQAMILCMAHSLTGEQTYLDGAIQITDYIFGKNATGYSFLTGYGDVQVMNVHHRPSGADGIAAPVPGFIAGGPNKDQQDIDYVEYRFDLPAKSFEDVEGSFASNEVCINWNAPAVFVLAYLEQVTGNR